MSSPACPWQDGEMEVPAGGGMRVGQWLGGQGLSQLEVGKPCGLSEPRLSPL